MLALAWTQLQDHGPDTTMAAGFALGQAETASAFVAAAELYRGAQREHGLPTRSDSIGMISPGLVPIRRQGDGRMPVPGWTGTYDWAGTLPAAALPRRLDPPSGLLVNANNRLVDADYPFFLAADWEEPFRAQRITELLAGDGPFDLDQMQAVQLDQVSGLARDFLPFLPAADAGPASQRDARAALAAWDGTMRVDRPEPLIFAAWQREFGLWLAGRARGRSRRPRRWAAGLRAPGVGRLQKQRSRLRRGAASTLATAVAGLEQHYGSDWRTWRWGDAHPAVLGHRPFDAQPGLRDWFSRLVPVGGDATGERGRARASSRGNPLRRSARCRLPGDLRPGPAR